jgi:tetratricopeptide (TPR) repeat protein
MKTRNRLSPAEFILLGLTLTLAPICGYLLTPRQEEQFSMMMRDGRYSDAADTLKALRDSGDRRAFILPALATAYHGSGQTGRAVETMKFHLESFPQDGEGFHQLSQLYAEMNMPNAMIDALARQYAIKPSKDVFMQLASLYRSFGRYDEERRLLLLAFEETSYPEVTHLLRLGESLASAGDNAEAIKALLELDQNLAPDQERGRILLFDLLVAEGRIKEATERAALWIAAWRRPWTAMRLVDRIAASSASQAQMEAFAEQATMQHPEMRDAIARVLIAKGQISVARRLLRVEQMQSSFVAAKLPSRQAALELLRTIDILDDSALLWWAFSRSLAKPGASDAQAVISEALAVRVGVQALAAFRHIISNRTPALEPTLAVRLAIATNNRALARKVLSSIDRRSVEPAELERLAILKADAL